MPLIVRLVFSDMSNVPWPDREYGTFGAHLTASVFEAGVTKAQLCYRWRRMVLPLQKPQRCRGVKCGLAVGK